MSKATTEENIFIVDTKDIKLLVCIPYYIGEANVNYPIVQLLIFLSLDVFKLKRNVNESTTQGWNTLHWVALIEFARHYLLFTYRMQEKLIDET